MAGLLQIASAYNIRVSRRELSSRNALAASAIAVSYLKLVKASSPCLTNKLTLSGYLSNKLSKDKVELCPKTGLFLHETKNKEKTRKIPKLFS